MFAHRKHQALEYEALEWSIPHIGHQRPKLHLICSAASIPKSTHCNQSKCGEIHRKLKSAIEYIKERSLWFKPNILKYP